MEIALARQRASFVGALLILVAYGGHQMGGMNSRSTLYNILNARSVPAFSDTARCIPSRSDWSSWRAFGH
jgi:hypothetical protein